MESDTSIDLSEELSFVPSAQPAPEPEVEKDPWTLFLDKYRYDPVGFCEDILGCTPVRWQREFMNRMSGPDPVRRLATRSGHGIGKTAAVSMLCVHRLVTTYPIKVVVTAPSAATLESNLLPEIKSWIKKMPDWLQRLFEVRSDKIFLKADPDAAFIHARTSSAERPESLAGIHAQGDRSVLLVVDEGSGVPEQVYEAAAGSMSSEGAQTVIIGNPTRSVGYFANCFSRNMKTEDNPDGWDTMHVSCLDVVDEGMVTESFVNEMRAAYGEESTEFRVRVLGEFALTDDTALIGKELIESAMVRDIEVDPLEPIIFGIDPARQGPDRQVLCIRQGNVVIGFKSWRQLNLMQLAGHIVNEAKIYKPAELVIDVIGLGAGLADRLRELGYNVRDCNVAEVSAMNPQAERLRDELWMSLRDWLATRACKLPEDATLKEEIGAPTYTFASSGKLKVESKDGMRKRLRRSPDMADALCLTFASMAAGVGGRKTAWNGQPLRRRIRGIV